MTAPHDPPQLFILAGPNGAGKSTTARVLLPETLGIEQFVNADNIAAGLSPFAPQTAQVEAGKIMLRRIRELLQTRQSFAFETTLAGRAHAGTIRAARDAGCLIHLMYIWLRSAELAVERVAHRVRQGGHDVPVAVILRRYDRGMANFFNLYRPLADTWTVCDNSGKVPVVVAQGSRWSETNVHDPIALRQFEECKRDDAPLH